ncbi:multisubunit sodium/proton antiporter, MrpG subunit [Desulfatibacillum alkenivorans DSM 16219]|jgi:multicomponent Na+:H+ antiporter subunit G|uniref:Multisubunit sodium/proton antiporter, MrpG subunit n=1 Tax=Desulfatibacillum alkenivorans DSM 16219 TaxID=1121393 RepID=A0A1M6QRL7_9BACT|nr:monovalent cation/H(+) antiporter subunit G [Desulfatibacillum alkenivorans]SHK22825.1 multisubunit sodium/proton antiporter, MrpG subunit [Desulfatibacillum alkenivorans DSM 16219]
MLDVLTVLLTLGGLVFFAGATMGILRFPDFYTRLHAAGKLDTLGALLTMAGLAVYNLDPFSMATLLTSLKIGLAVGFIFIASPTATHAIVDAGVRAGLRPWVKQEDEQQ